MTDQDADYRRSQFDEPWDFTVSSGVSPDFALRYDFTEFRDWLRDQFKVLSWNYIDYRYSPKPSYTFLIEYRNPPRSRSGDGSFETNGECIENKRRIIMFEAATPRFLVGFVRSFQERFPVNSDIITVIHSLTYARFDPKLSDEDAMHKMLTDDEELMRELGVVQ